MKTLLRLFLLLFISVTLESVPIGRAETPEAAVNSNQAVRVPPPVNPSPPLPAPPLRPIVQPRRDAALIQRLTPRVEIWRPNSNHPQIPVRFSNSGRSDSSLVTGPEVVMIRLRFSPQSAGEPVTVLAARGIVLDPPEQVLTVSAQGDCAFAAQLAQNAPVGHVIIYCKNVRTVVPLQRAPLAAVQAKEAQSEGQP